MDRLNPLPILCYTLCWAAVCKSERTFAWLLDQLFSHIAVILWHKRHIDSPRWSHSSGWNVHIFSSWCRSHANVTISTFDWLPVVHSLPWCCRNSHQGDNAHGWSTVVSTFEYMHWLYVVKSQWRQHPSVFRDDQMRKRNMQTPPVGGRKLWHAPFVATSANVRQTPFILQD